MYVMPTPDALLSVAGYWLCAIHVGAPGIEPGPYAPKAYILPLYYAPLFDNCCSLSLSYYNEIVDKVNRPCSSMDRTGDF